MKNIDGDIRNAVRAVITRDKHILLLRKKGGHNGDRYALPGGAQDSGETLAQALQRECREEIGTDIQIDGLIHVADFFKKKGRAPERPRHQVEFLFKCAVPKAYKAKNGKRPDKYQVDVVWVKMERLEDVALLPKYFTKILKRGRGKNGVYLGSVD